MKRIIRIVALLMAALMAVTSCQAPDSGSQLTSETVDVSFAGPSARTITTDDGLVQTVATSDLWFQYKAEWQGGGDPPNTAKTEWTRLDGPGLTGTVKLHRGIWNLSLRAFVNQSDVGTEGKCILSGSLPRVEIGANNLVTQTVSINLGYVRQEGNGTLHVSATYPVVYHEAANPEVSPVEAVRKVKVTANVAGTDYTGDITAFDSNNVGTLDLTVPAGAAHVTVQYYMDDSTLFEGDQASKDVLIMATMTTNLAVSVDRDITAVTFEVVQPAGSVEDNVIARAASLFDIYPDRINENEIVIGYAEQTKALGDQTPITYPYTTYATASRDEQGRYKASDLNLVPITVTAGADLIASGATSAWWGKTAIGGDIENQNINTTLASVRFVDGVTAIGEAAFFGCTSLINVTIPASVTSIGDGAFSGCTSLSNIEIPVGVTSIGMATFAECSSLTSVVIPNSVTSIGEQAFYKCSSLTSITIPSSVTSIGNHAFLSCIRLTDLTLSEGVKTIGQYAFARCSGLTEVTIPKSITEAMGAFANCENLTKVVFAEGTTTICAGITIACPSLIDITIPSSVTSIGDGAFSSCTSLTSITIPNSVTSIGSRVFNGCSSLTSVTIPDSVTSIGENAFLDCTSLTNIYVNQAESTLLDSASVPSGTCTIHWNSPEPGGV